MNFVAVYLMMLDVWYIVPTAQIAGQKQRPVQRSLAPAAVNRAALQGRHRRLRRLPQPLWVLERAVEIVRGLVEFVFSFGRGRSGFRE